MGVALSVRDMTLEAEHHLTPDATAELRALYDPHPAWGERSREAVRAVIENSDVVVGVRDTAAGSLVASARVLTDYRFQAIVYDVIVDESRRGEGLGRRVMDAVVGHPDLQDVDLSLHCREGLVPFYEDCGFELHDRDVEVLDGETVTYRTMRYERDE
jgi:predicted GNAT family N-acyltransferase